MHSNRRSQLRQTRLLLTLSGRTPPTTVATISFVNCRTSTRTRQQLHTNRDTPTTRSNQLRPESSNIRRCHENGESTSSCRDQPPPASPFESLIVLTIRSPSFRRHSHLACETIVREEELENRRTREEDVADLF
ncbi:unnamed protein product [Vicia faba]|uniref:Uncharacterized protein n=1 Tax=Vicia faba TaxID=3906 RepID=A0AAV0Z6M2_VICFA|nr:unnamed protein product [Vicia faba]